MHIPPLFALRPALRLVLLPIWRFFLSKCLKNSAGAANPPPAWRRAPFLAAVALLMLLMLQSTAVQAQVPALVSISPNSGPTAGGTTVTITGTNLTGATAVNFGSNNAASYVVNSASSITATSPTGSAGTVDITVTTPDGSSTTSAADQFTYVVAPNITRVSPTSGPASGGTTVIITGTNFSGATAVTFGGAAATGFTVNSATQITATAPAGSGTVDIRVTTTGGTSATSAADQYTYMPAPTISSVSPASGTTGGGTSVTITGSNFSGVTAVTFGSTAASFVAKNATEITATAPAGTGHQY